MGEKLGNNSLTGLRGNLTSRQPVDPSFQLKRFNRIRSHTSLSRPVWDKISVGVQEKPLRL